MKCGLGKGLEKTKLSSITAF